MPSETLQVFRSFQGTRGISDIIAIAPRTGRLIACECKHGSGRLSTSQKDFLGRIAAAGGLALVVYHIADLDNALRIEGLI